MPQTQINLDWKWGAILALILQCVLTFVIVVYSCSQPAPDPSVKEDIKALRVETTAGFKTLGDKLGKHGSSGAAP